MEGVPRQKKGKLEGTEGVLQFRVVFILPKLTNKHTLAILIAAALSWRNFSLRTLLVLLLLVMAST